MVLVLTGHSKLVQVSEEVIALPFLPAVEALIVRNTKNSVSKQRLQDAVTRFNHSGSLAGCPALWPRFWRMEKRLITSE